MKHIVISSAILFNTIVLGQSKNIQHEFVGSWELVSINNIHQDGTKKQPYGSNPDGLLIFDKDGNYAIQILKENRPLIVSGNKNTSTPEENVAIVKGFNAHYGKYTVDAQNKTITFKILHASFPNWENKVQKRTYSYNNNVIKYIVTNTTQGGDSVVAEVVWKKRASNQ